MSEKKPGFIELNRRFERLNPQAKPETSAFENYTRALSGEEQGLGWVDLLKRRLVVVLGEPGCGKTEEFTQKAGQLSSTGEYAFFVRLDQFLSQTIQEILGPRGYERYEEWRRGRRSATFFLDSVDEAKFYKPADFFVALDHFRNALGTDALTRCSLFLSSRIIDWQPQRDAHEVLYRFPTPPPKQTPNNALRRTPDQPSSDSEQALSCHNHNTDESILVVEILPLDRTRVERFAEARTLTDSKRFIQALDDSHAWEFARRPADVIDLINFWNTRGRFGSFSELIEFNVEHNLRPSERDKNDPLSIEEARDGAEYLAAATVFCRRLHFSVPDEMHVTREALDAFSCLPQDWAAQKIRALLSRPLFDSAAYGSIRFHHRRIGEFLAAHWLKRRMDNGCPTTVLLELLFESRDDQHTLRPSMAPITAWLCCGNQPWNSDLQSRVLAAAPGIHLQYGDPSCLTLEYKRKLLRGLIRAYEGRNHVWINSTPQSLARLGDPALAPEISEMIRDRGLLDDLRIELIQVVRHARLVAALDAVLEVVADDTESLQLRSYAATAVRDAGDPSSRHRLAVIATNLSRIPNSVCSRLVETLYPETIDVHTLLQLLQKTDPVPAYSVDIPYYLTAHLKGRITLEDVAPMIHGLVELGKTQPHLQFAAKTRPVSRHFLWVREVLPVLVDLLLQRSSLLPDESTVVAGALQWLGFTKDFVTDYAKQEVGNVQELTRKHPRVRRDYFWYQVNNWRREHNAEPKDQFDVFSNWETLRPEKGDIEWLTTDIKQTDDAADRELALRMALEIWDYTGRKWKQRRDIRRSVVDEPALRSIYFATVKIGLLKRLQRLWYRRIIYRFGPRWRWARLTRQAQIHLRSLRNVFFFLRHLLKLSSGEETQWLDWIIHKANKANDQWSSIDLRDMNSPFWMLIGRVARHGCKRAWRRFDPGMLDSTNLTYIDHRTVIGLIGIQAEITDGELDFLKLSDEHAKIAAHYAIKELNGFAPWLKDLAKKRPVPVSTVLRECMLREWFFKAELQHAYAVMHDLTWHGDGLVHLIKTPLLDLLRSSDPPNYSILSYALFILLSGNEELPSDIKEIARNRVQQYASNQPTFVLWLAIWLQVDAQRAIVFLEETLRSLSEPCETVLRLCSALAGENRDRVPLLPNPDYLKIDALQRLVLLVYTYVNPTYDVERAGTGVFTPDDRDYAQHLRSNLVSRLAATEDKRAVAVLRELADAPSLGRHRDWLLYLADTRTEKNADLSPWDARDVRQFAIDHETDPRTDHDLFTITCKRLIDLKNDVEKSDNSLREELHYTDKEAALRRWLARKLSERSRNRYRVPQEEEIDQQDRPDLRIENPKTDPVSIEVKWAEKWSVVELLERLENQLFGQYLRAHNSHYGVYLVGTIEPKRYWRHPSNGEHLSFHEVVELLKARAKEIVAKGSGAKDVIVIGIDFRLPT